MHKLIPGTKSTRSGTQVRKILWATVSCVVVLSGLVVFEHTPKAEASISTQNDKLDSLKTYKQKAKFIFLVEEKLKEEGYNSTLVRMLYASQDTDKREITIEISESEYKGKQTKDKINKVINHIAEVNKLGSIVVHVKIIKGIS